MLCLILIFFLLDPKGSKNEATHKKGTFLFFSPFFLFFLVLFFPDRGFVFVNHSCDDVERTKKVREMPS